MKLRTTSQTAFLELATQAKAAGKHCVPVCLEFIDDELTPVLVHTTLAQNGERSFLYESVEGGERTARYSYLGFAPYRRFVYQKGQVVIFDAKDQVAQTVETTDPRQLLNAELESMSCLSAPGLPDFIGGLVGNIGYDAVRIVEPTVPDTCLDDSQLPDISLMYFDTVIAFDHVEKKVYLVTLVDVNDELSKAYHHATQRLELLYRRLCCPRHVPLIAGAPESGYASNMDEQTFKAMVKRAKEYIVAGDAFQIVVSQRFKSKLVVEPFTVYRCLRHTNPAPFLFYINFGDYQMIGSSPEILVEAKNRQVKISPIAGTRPRDLADVDRDNDLAQELLADPKERAEHIMLVDLARNDVGRVAQPGSVHIPADRLMFVERYSTVMHIVSDVVGKLQNGLSPLDALWASLPAGTLSGAPKVRAMQIIDELEPTRRGPYGGAVGFLGFDGNLVTAIVIRTAVTNQETITWQAGCGIVADSDPDKELEESWNKSRSILQALILAGNTLQRKEATANETSGN